MLGYASFGLLGERVTLRKKEEATGGRMFWIEEFERERVDVIFVLAQKVYMASITGWKSFKLTE